MRWLPILETIRGTQFYLKSGPDLVESSLVLPTVRTTIAQENFSLQQERQNVFSAQRIFDRNHLFGSTSFHDESGRILVVHIWQKFL